MASLSSLNFRLTANIAPFKKGLNKAERALDSMGRKMQQTGKNLSMKLTAPLAALGAVSFNVFKNFEAEMAKVKAVSGATAQEFESLSKNAKELGASTQFSATEVAGLQTEFAKLGFTATEITKVTEGTLALAQASGSDLARAAEVAGSTLRAFGMDASETGRVTDVMALSFSSSALDMEVFAESMKYVAPVAKSAGMSLEQTSAMLAVLANNGIKGSAAGTALRRIISQLGATGGDVQGAIKNLAAEGLNLADAKDEVGRSAQSALLILAEGVDQIDPLTESFENSAGAAKEMSDIMGDTALGAGKRLESAMEGLGISIGEIIAEAVVPLVEGLAKLASKLNSASPSTKKMVVVFAALLAAIGPVLFIVGGMIRNFILLKNALKAANIITKISTALQRAYNLVLNANPIGVVITAVMALVAAYKLLNATKKDAIKAESTLSDEANEAISTMQLENRSMNNLLESLKNGNLTNDERRSIINKLNTEYKDYLPNLLSEKSTIEEITAAQKSANDEFRKKIKITAFQDQINQRTEEAIAAQKDMNTLQSAYNDLVAKGVDPSEITFGQSELEELGISMVELGQAKKGFFTKDTEQQDLESLFKSLNAVIDESSAKISEVESEINSLSQSPGLEETGQDANALAGGLGNAATAAGDLGEETKRTAEALTQLPLKEISFNFESQFVPVMETARRQMVNFTALAIQVGQTIQGAFANAFVAAFSELEEGETRFGKFKESLTGMLRDMIIQFTAAAIAAFALAVAVRMALGGVGGVGSMADIFGTMQSIGGFMPNIPMLAEGGIVTAPTLAMIGEGGQSEAVIPLDRLGDFGGGNRVEVYGRISGSDILLSQERAQRNRTRQRGF